MAISKPSKSKSKIKPKRKKNPADIKANRLIAVKYIQSVADIIYNQIEYTVRDISMKDLDDAVKRIYTLQNDLNINGFALPKYLTEEPKRKWENDPERWI